MTDYQDPTAGRHGGNPESAEAHTSIKAEVPKILALILDRIRGLGAANCDDIERASSLSHQTCSARFRELKDLGLIEPTGERSITRSGRYAKVYQVTGKAYVPKPRFTSAAKPKPDFTALTADAYRLCLLIEGAGASPKLTECSVAASELRQKLASFQ